VNPESRLKRVLFAGHFAVTAECGPPKGADPDLVRKKGNLLKGYVDSVNVTDNQTGVVRLCSLAACALLREEGLDPVLQMVTRDRNRIALQSDVLGASALGIRNLLCLSGDHQSFGNQADAKGVFDLDSIQFLRAVRQMRDGRHILGGEELSRGPDLFIGAAENPFADPFFLPRSPAGEKKRPPARSSSRPVHLQPPEVQGMDGPGARAGAGEKKSLF